MSDQDSFRVVHCIASVSLRVLQENKNAGNFFFEISLIIYSPGNSVTTLPVYEQRRLSFPGLTGKEKTAKRLIQECMPSAFRN
ncbi:conserved hypothetical protein [Ricinus communis]|uniref:Uncharacterized protein n=1 Tax=Ricinus communis TaxID=3988 RepID=B9SCC7_RICCO|nr:conserved hypothetical protein [Ricinus communis]